MTSTHLELATRWGARISAAGSLLLLSAFIFGGNEQSTAGPTATQWIGLAFFPIGIIVGLLVAYWKEIPGGGITVLSLAGFYVWHFVVSGKLSCGPWFALFAAPGFLFLVAGLVARHRFVAEDAGALESIRRNSRVV